MTTRLMLVPVHRSPGAGFDEPFEMLEACHERVERMLRLLQRLRSHLREQGHDEQARQAARDVLRYFDMAAPQHHEDEERHVFPALRAAGRLNDTLDRLQSEHREMTTRWGQVRELLLRVERNSVWVAFTPEEEDQMTRYAELYAWHMSAENELVYPAAAQLLDARDRQAMGQEMSRRRGVTVG